MGDVTEQLLAGMDVYDVDGIKVGKVVKYDRTLGYVETLGAFSGPRFIPFFAIESIGPAGANLNVTKWVVSDIYDRLPSVTPDLTPGGRLTGGGTVMSGHSGKTVPLDAEALRLVHEEIHSGTTVLDVDNENLGTIQAYDGSTGYMRIEKDGLTVKNIFLPVTSVSFLDDDGIHLYEAKDTLMSRYCRVPEIAREFYA
ncbi:MAG TPA: hypothetical protein VH853_14475 [Polyangia bacterium]|jgi:hypothetical protein|nr:hypothetical protein [Polyangia bacterium]